MFLSTLRVGFEGCVEGLPELATRPLPRRQPFLKKAARNGMDFVVDLDLLRPLQPVGVGWPLNCMGLTRLALYDSLM